MKRVIDSGQNLPCVKHSHIIPPDELVDEPVHYDLIHVFVYVLLVCHVADELGERSRLFVFRKFAAHHLDREGHSLILHFLVWPKDGANSIFKRMNKVKNAFHFEVGCSKSPTWLIYFEE